MTLNSGNQNFLREKFKNRLTFDPIERKLYGHDIAAIPALVKLLIGNTTPDAVVQPGTEEELIELVNWARMKKIPLTPRGKWYWLREYMEGRAEWDQKIVDTFLVCTTCEMCDRRCSAALPIEPSWMKLRGKLIDEDKRMTFPPFVMMAEALRAEGDIWAGYMKDRAAWFPEDLLEKHGPRHGSKNVYFAGCTASYVEKDIGIASVRLL